MRIDTLFPFDDAVDMLKAIAEPTRLRLLVLLSRHDLTVTDLMSILGQSQPRISRHLKLLTECGILSRYQEGAWAYFRLSDQPSAMGFTDAVLSRLDRADPVLRRDAERLEGVRRQRSANAASYFAKNAGSWDRIRSLHAPDTVVEAALLSELGDRPIRALLDIGTGTGRMLELLAPRCGRAVGIDASREMLAIARAKLDAADISNAVVRQGDAFHLPVERGGFDLVLIHQVLHYLDDPAAAIAEAAAALAPGGRLAVIDFAPHALEFLRVEHAHLRLGFGDEALAGHLRDAGLDVTAIRSLRPEGRRADQLTVTIWLARDGRRLLASAAEPMSAISA